MIQPRRLHLLLLLAGTFLAGSETARAQGPVKGRGFQLFAATAIRFEVNRVSCTISTESELCAYNNHSYGGVWPKNTPNTYVFNSGPQVAGIIGVDGGPWANDTSGAYFYDAKGTTQHGSFVQGVFLFGDSANDWPEAARISGGRYHPILQGRASASEADAWWLTWDGNPGLLAGRPHPLGLVLEGRALGWNYPGGNQDIVYYILTYHNITSLDPAAYALNPAPLRTELLKQAQQFHELNTARFGVALPPQGYTIRDAYLGMAADMDVGNAGSNFASVNLPFALGFAWDWGFSNDSYYSLPPDIHSPPFFAGFGLGGVKFLGGTEGAGDLTIYTNTTNGGSGIEPRDVQHLYRLLSNNVNPSLGDGTCFADVAITGICFIRTTSPADIRQHQSTGPFTLAPGGSVTLAVAYVFAAPVRTGATSSCPSCSVYPGNLSIVAGLSDPSIVAGGVNPIDSIAGFLSASDVSGDRVLQEQEFITVPRSLYWKAQLAQAIFDHQFLLPSPPASPEFFLIPGDGQVTVMWRPSATEQTGDPFFAVARDAQVLNDQGVLVANPLYDPNFRQFDVEGYRVYRGRVDDLAAMTQVAQFDYAGTVISDYAGQVNPERSCAPEIPGVSSCGFDPVLPGVARIVHQDVPLAGQIVQVRIGDRIPLPDGTAIHLVTDTAPDLADTGVPFVYVDNTVRNNFRYFYAVTAFDLNSWQSGPSSFQSPRILKSVTPVRPASNYANRTDLTTRVYGRGMALTDSIMPDIDPATGRFSKPFPPTQDWFLTLENVVPQVTAAPGGRFSLFLDSLTLGDPYGAAGNCVNSTTPITYYLRIVTPADTTGVTLPILQDCFNVAASFSTTFDAIPADPALASRYGGTGQFSFRGSFTAELAGNYYTNSFGRGCVNAAPGFAFANTPQTGCDYNGARWFDGPSPANNETVAHPNACSAQNNTVNSVTCFSNAGSVTGVVNIFEAKSYQTTPNIWREVEAALGGAVRGADYNVYWSTGGTVDSVVDVTNNVLVPFSNTMGAGWGFLNQGAAQPSGGGQGFDARVELSLADFGCVEPFRSLGGPQLRISCGGTLATADGPVYTLSSTAIPGPIVNWAGPITESQTDAVAANAGFAMYLSGHLFMFELAGGQVPPAGTVWSMRDYTGSIRGGGVGCSLCQAGADGPYAFVPRPRPLGVGAELRFTVDVVNQVNAPTRADLSRVHTVPDPYYLSNEFEADNPGQVIKFVNLPEDAVIRIYTSSGVLVSLLEHHSTIFGGAVDWNVRNRTGRRVASGVYFYHVEAGNARLAGRFTVVNDRPGF